MRPRSGDPAVHSMCLEVAAPVAGPPKLTFPIPGSMEGVKCLELEEKLLKELRTGSKSVLEVKLGGPEVSKRSLSSRSCQHMLFQLRHVSFRYSKDNARGS